MSWDLIGSSFEETWIHFTQGCFVPRLFKLAQWLWRRGFKKKISSMYFMLFSNYFPLGKGGPFIWRNLNPLHPRMLCATFGWNLLSGSWEKRWKCEKFTDRQTTDGRWLEKLTWAFSSGELIIFRGQRDMYNNPFNHREVATRCNCKQLPIFN